MKSLAFLVRMIIFTRYEHVMDKLTNAKYDWNLFCSSGASNMHIHAGKQQPKNWSFIFRGGETNIYLLKSLEQLCSQSQNFYIYYMYEKQNWLEHLSCGLLGSHPSFQSDFSFIISYFSVSFTMFLMPSCSLIYYVNCLPLKHSQIIWEILFVQIPVCAPLPPIMNKYWFSYCFV